MFVNSILNQRKANIILTKI